MHRVPCFRLSERLAFSGGKDLAAFKVDLVVPVKGVRFMDGHSPVLRHLYQRGDGDRRRSAVESLPFPGAFAGMIPPVGAAPFIPHGAVIALVPERHADVDPFLIAEIRRMYVV